MHDNQQSHIEGIFARGDRRVGDLLEAAFRLGCRFDSWDDALRMDLWEQAIAETTARTGLDIGRPLGTMPVTGRLPWSHIDIGLEPDFLAKEYRKALKDRLSPPCGKPYKKLLHPSSVAAAEAGAKDKLICYDCGIACDLGAMKGERLFFLRRMNAWTGAATATAVERRATRSRAARPAQDPTRPPPRAAQGEPHGYRLRYTKLGHVAYLGHLDLVRHLPRIFRRAGLEIYYSVGFHPKPDLSFGPALGLGIPSLGEVMDVRLLDELDARGAAAAAQPRHAGRGRVHRRVARRPQRSRAGPGDRRGRVPGAAAGWCRSGGGAGVVRGDAPLVVRRESEKGIARTVDVRKTLRSLAASTTRSCARRLDWDAARCSRSP